MELNFQTIMDEIRKAPELDLLNLTPQGRLQQTDYNRALDYLRHLNDVANRFSDKYPGERNLAQEQFNLFLQTLPKQDSDDLVMKLLDENVDISFG